MNQTHKFLDPNPLRLNERWHTVLNIVIGPQISCIKNLQNIYNMPKIQGYPNEYLKLRDPLKLRLNH